MPGQGMATAAFLVAGDLNAGLRFYILANYAAAARCYRRALRREPEDALCHYLLGLVLMTRGKSAEARIAWKIASRSENTDVQTLWARSSAQMLLDQVHWRPEIS